MKTPNMLTLLALLSMGFAASGSAQTAQESPQLMNQEARDVIFVGNNWEGMIDVIDADNYQHLGRINGIPDRSEREEEISGNFIHYLVYLGIKHLVGEGNHQYVDDMYSTLDGRYLIVSRPSFADVVAIELSSGNIKWRFPVKGYRSDHMALSPDGSEVAVSASTGKVVHILDVESGKELTQFASGTSPHENVYSKDGSKIYHASIGSVWTNLDAPGKRFLKGKRIFKVVDRKTMQDLKSFDMSDKLKEAGYENLSPAVRPMAHTSDERTFYFQLSFLHGFIEYDMENDKVTRLVELPNLIPNVPITDYVNDSAHHGIALSGDDKTLCVAGTMDDYVAMVDRATMEAKLLKDIGAKPYWVTTDKSGEHCYISWSETDQMSVISYSTGEEVARVNVGRHPQRIREGYVSQQWLTKQ